MVKTEEKENCVIHYIYYNLSYIQYQQQEKFQKQLDIQKKKPNNIEDEAHIR